MYSFKELLELFHLNYEFDLNELKRAKMIVLKMHPDKSQLNSDYFLFYKKAFDIILDYYKDTQKSSQVVPNTEQMYKPLEGQIDKNTQKTIASNIKELGVEKFSSTFNQLFENNMVKKPDNSKNDWFKNNDPLYQFDEVSSNKNIGVALESIREKTASIVQYKGVENMKMNSGSQLYDEDDESNGSYVTCDPFSKLKYDDLRKVHKDQTVFSVSERDFDKVKKYSSMDHLQRERGSAQFTPIEKTKAENILAEQEEEMRKRMLSRQHAAQLQSMQYAEKNKNVLSAFLQLKN